MLRDAMLASKQSFTRYLTGRAFLLLRTSKTAVPRCSRKIASKPTRADQINAGRSVSHLAYSFNALGPAKMSRLPTKCPMRKPRSKSPVNAMTNFLPIELA